MIDERLIGTWWAIKKNGISYSIFKGPSACSPSGALPDNAKTNWHTPFDEELQKILWGIDTVLFYNDNANNSRNTTKISVKDVTFPPEEYIDDNSITEIEIKPNGDYVIFDSIQF